MEQACRRQTSFGWVSVWVFAALLLTAWPALGQFNRPDLLDATSEYFTTGTGGSAAGASNHLTPRFGLGGAITSYGGSVNGAMGWLHKWGPSGSGLVSWGAFEPDKVTRKATKDSLVQGAYVQISGYGSTLPGHGYWYFPYYGALVPGCKAQVSVKDSNGDGTADSAKWKVTCDSTALTTLGLSPAEQAAFKAVFGATTIKIKGKTP